MLINDGFMQFRDFLSELKKLKMKKKLIVESIQ